MNGDDGGEIVCCLREIDFQRNKKSEKKERDRWMVREKIDFPIWFLISKRKRERGGDWSLEIGGEWEWGVRDFFFIRKREIVPFIF